MLQAMHKTVRHQDMLGKATTTCRSLGMSNHLPYRLVGLSYPSTEQIPTAVHRRPKAVTPATRVTRVTRVIHVTHVTPGMEASQSTPTQGMLIQARLLLFLLSMLGIGSQSHPRQLQGSHLRAFSLIALS